MRIEEAIGKAKGSPLFTFEILPPEKGMEIQSIYDTIDPLIKFDPKFIEVTYHREEVEFRELADGTIQRFNDTYILEPIPRGSNPVGADFMLEVVLYKWNNIDLQLINIQTSA